MRRLLLVLLSLLPLSLYAQGAGTPPFRGSATWNLIWPSDNTFDIGASGATRPRTGYFGTSVITPALTVSGLTSGRVPVASTGGSFVDFSTFTFSGGTVTATNLVATSGVTAASVTDSGLTSGRIAFASTGGLLADDADLTFDGTTLESSAQINLSGPDAATNTEIGSNSFDASAGAGGSAVVIGGAASSTGASNVCIGVSAACGSGTVNVMVGRGATHISNGAAATAIGFGASAGERGTAVGTQAVATGGVALGPAASAGVNEFVVGSANTGTTSISNVYFGKGKTNATATEVTINGTGGTGTDNPGEALWIAGGKGTGTAKGGNTGFLASPSLTTGTTAQTLERRFLVVAQRFNLTDNTIATFGIQTLGNDTGGGGTVNYCVYARDATTAGLECGHVDFAGIDVTAGAGGEVCPTPTKQGTPLQALSGSTLAVTFAASTGTDLCNLRVTADTNIATPLELWITWSADNSGRPLTPQ